MVQTALEAELLSMQKQAERTAQNINQIECRLSAEQESLQRVVKEHGAKRVELFKQILHARGMTWCTRCSEMTFEGETELLLLEGREEYSHGYGNADYGFRSFSQLHRACPACRELATDAHGRKGAYDSRAEDQAIFYAFHVEKREDGYYARKFGNLIKLDDKDCLLGEPSSRLVEKLAEECDLPPQMETGTKWPSPGRKLIIHERVAMAEAS